MKKVLLVIFALISLNVFSQINIKEGSFRKIDGYVMLDKSEHLDDNDNPMALIMITTENINAEERAKFTYKGNVETFFDVKQQEDGQTYLYLSAEPATFIEIIHPDYGKTEYAFPFELCDFCGYEMVVQYVPLVPIVTQESSKPKKTYLIVKSDQTDETLQAGKEITITTDQSGDKIYVDGNYIDVSPITTTLSYGSHEIKTERNGKTVSKTVNVAQNGVSNVELKFNEENGHEYVDLGLSVKWATCNVGANKPEDYGNYYSWGETSKKSDYTGSNCATYGLSKSELQSQGYIDGAGNLNPQYDAARANWGGSWRMPTIAELNELSTKCTCTWTTQEDVNGYKVTGPSGASIFLPAAGYRDGSSLDYAGCYGNYWSSTPSGYYACYLFFNSSSHYMIYYGRNDGRSVRPVVE